MLRKVWSGYAAHRVSGTDPEFRWAVQHEVWLFEIAKNKPDDYYLPAMRQTSQVAQLRKTQVEGCRPGFEIWNLKGPRCFYS